jgi:HEAT repeat protein
MLPQRPSLFQLRTQARELQRAYNSGDPLVMQQVLQHLPTVRLTADRRIGLMHAQTVLARRYGFASWSLLCGHVEQILAEGSMSHLRDRRQTPAQMAERIALAAEQGDLGALFAALRIGKRDSNTVRTMLVTQGRFPLIVDALLSGVSHPSARVRFLTAQAFDHWADERCGAALWVLLRDPTPRVRWAALHSLQCAACKLAPVTVAVDLVGTIAALALHDPSVKVRRVAAWELAQLCPEPQARTALEQVCAQELDPIVQRNAQIGLRRN